MGSLMNFVVVKYSFQTTDVDVSHRQAYTANVPYTSTLGGHLNGKRGYQAPPWTHKKHLKHIFPGLKFVAPKQV